MVVKSSKKVVKKKGPVKKWRKVVKKGLRKLLTADEMYFGDECDCSLCVPVEFECDCSLCTATPLTSAPPPPPPAPDVDLRSARDKYLTAAHKLKLDAGPYKAARDAYVAATSSYTRFMFGGGGGGNGTTNATAAHEEEERAKERAEQVSKEGRGRTG